MYPTIPFIRVVYRNKKTGKYQKIFDLNSSNVYTISDVDIDQASVFKDVTLDTIYPDSSYIKVSYEQELRKQKLIKISKNKRIDD